jgi:cytochrome c556
MSTAAQRRGRWWVLSALLLAVLTIVPLTYFSLQQTNERARLMKSMERASKRFHALPCTQTRDIQALQSALESIRKHAEKVPVTFVEAADARFVSHNSDLMRATLGFRQCQQKDALLEAVKAACEQCHRDFQ